MSAANLPFEFNGFNVIHDIAPMSDMEFLDAAENGLWAAWMHSPHDTGLVPIVKDVDGVTGRTSWQIGESWTTYDEARLTAAKYAIHVLRVQDSEVRDQALVRHFVTRSLVRIDVQ